MADFSVRSDNVDVEEIMGQIRARIREKHGVDYTEEEIHELARVKLEKFLDPRGVRSGLLERYRQKRAASEAPRNYRFEDRTLFESSRPILRFVRRVLRPILKLFFNPNPLIEALHIQSTLNDSYNESESLSYELMHNLVLETTRMGIEVKNLKMRLESTTSRLDFDERRARALEGVVQYRPGAVAPLQPPTGAGPDRPLTEAEQAERRSRRRRRRGRRKPGSGDGREEPGTGMSGQPRDQDRSFDSRRTRAESSHGGDAPGSPRPAGNSWTGGGGGEDRPAAPTPDERAGHGNVPDAHRASDDAWAGAAPGTPRSGAGSWAGDGPDDGPALAPVSPKAEPGVTPGESGKPPVNAGSGEGGPVPPPATPKPGPDVAPGEAGPVSPKPGTGLGPGEGG